MTHPVEAPPTALTPEMAVVFGVTVLALVLFVSERLRVDVTAILVMVVLIVLGPWTTITPELGLSGFANPATLTVLAMFVLSEGVRRTGVVRTLVRWVTRFTGDSEGKQVAATVGIAGPLAGFVNNTPVVAMMIPMVAELAEKTKTSPSRLLIPLSYAAILGGTLTVIGTSPNILASDISDRLIDHPFGMFEFTKLGAVVLVTGVVYLLTVGRLLIPERIKPGEGPADRFELAEYLGEVRVGPESPVIGKTVREAIEGADLDATVARIVRGDRTITEPLAHRRIWEEDVLVVRADRDTLMELLEIKGLSPPVTVEDRDEEEEGNGSGRASGGPAEGADEEKAADAGSEVLEEDTLAEVIVLPDTPLVGRTLASLHFRQRYESTVLGIRRGGRLLTRRLAHVVLRGGDTLLVQTRREALERLARNRNFVVTRELERPDYRTSRAPVALGIVAAVVAVAAFGILPIVVAALAGLVAMVLTRCLDPTEIYYAIDWNVIFLLAGIIPLGIALERTGGAAYLGTLLLPVADAVPILLFAVLFYLLTALLTEVLTNVASIVLMAPVAVGVAFQIDSNPFAFLLLVTFAASSSLMTPVGYQTNLMVFGPGGYRFTDFLRVGIPLQLILAVVTAGGVAYFWGL